VPVVAVPGQPLAFSLDASETGQPASTNFTYTINWGDGTATAPDTQVITGVSGTSVSHVFKTTGNFTVAVTAADSVGNVTPQSATVAATLSTLALEADPGDATKTALFVGGTTGGDVITITPTNAAGTSVSVTLNAVAQKIGTATTFAPTGHIVVFGQAGTDTIKETAATINSKSVPVAIPALIFAGSGNDTLSVAGSSANNLLVGATGNDSLTSGSGRDILIGGSGASVLRAGTGGDLLIAGSTSYTPTVSGVTNPNVPALLALLAEWGRNTSYQARVQDLFAGGSGSLNGGNLLNPSTIQLSSVLDQIFAGSASDWLWFADNAKVVDQVNNLSGGGIVTFG
jgi:Ca2+-binding RTX toxin-like protein